jgi:hypothetical protein
MDSPGFGSRLGQEFLSFSSLKRPYRFWDPIGLLLSGHRWAFSLGVKWPGREADNSPPSSAEVKNEWSCTSTTCVFPYGVCRENVAICVVTIMDTQGMK